MEDRLAELVSGIRELAESVGETGVAASMRSLAADLERSTSESQRQAVSRRVLSLYGGPGSFHDVVLQNREGVLPEHKTFAELRSALYDEAKRWL